jgi:RimJ/RimL family protein N-acetyltransferase
MQTPTLEGHRVRLEPLTLALLPALEEIALGPDAAPHWRYFRDIIETPQDLRAWVENALKLEAAGTGMPWVTILKSVDSATPDKVAGTTRFIDLDLQNLTVEIGNTWLAPAFHGAEINPEAKLLQLTYAFETLKLRRVALKTHHENLQSQAAMRKLGAQYEGTFRNHYVMPDGSARHSVWFSITQEDWPVVRAQLVARLANVNEETSPKR